MMNTTAKILIQLSLALLTACSFNGHKPSESPTHVVIKQISAERAGNVKARDYLDISRVYSSASDTINVDTLYTKLLASNRSSAADTVKRNAVRFYNFKYEEHITGMKARVVMVDERLKDENPAQLVHHLELRNGRWIIVKIVNE